MQLGAIEALCHDYAAKCHALGCPAIARSTVDRREHARFLAEEVRKLLKEKKLDVDSAHLYMGVIIGILFGTGVYDWDMLLSHVHEYAPGRIHALGATPDWLQDDQP